MIDRRMVRILRKEMEDAFAPIEKKWGVKLAFGSCRFNDDRATYKLEAKRLGSDGVPTDFRKLADDVGLRLDAFESPFEHRNQLYRVVGVTKRRPKYPIDVERLIDKKRFKFPVRLVKTALELGK